MTYSQFGRVEASDYNTLAGNVNALFGTGNGNSGYGGNSSNVSLANLATKSTSQSVTAQDWRNLRNSISDLASHQGTTLVDALPALTLIEVGDLITFFTTLNSSPNLAILTANRLVVGSGNSSINTKLTSVRSTSWANFIRHEFDVTFASPDNARFFYNTGGAIIIDASRTGGSATDQNTAWSTGLSSTGPFTFTATNYFALTGSFTTLRNVSITGGGSGYAYVSNFWTISARRVDAAGPNGSNGSVIRFRSDFLDAHSNVFFDTIDGTFTSTIQERRSTGVFVRPSPVFTTVTSLTTGS